PVPPQYGLVFDAGSTHTSLYIYRWRGDKENGTGIVSQVEACRVSGECAGTCPPSPPAVPNTHSTITDPSLSACSGLKGDCPGRNHIEVHSLHLREPYRLCAWAGREENSSKAERVLAEVSKAIGEFPVDFRGARILAGSEEGSFGWITVNYLLETLVKFSFAERWEHPQDTEVLGALDLGGASTQITFQPGVPVQDRNTSVFFRLYGTNYSLYSHSYLCYGQSQALKRLLAALHQRLFNFSCPGAQGPCGFNGVHQPPVRGQFFAFAGFYYTFNFLNLTHQESLSEVNATILSFCRRNWTEVRALFPNDLKYLPTYCSVGIYILTLLLQGYKFDEHTWTNIHFSKQAANTDIGWTLGYMLNLTNMIPAEALQHLKGHQPGLWAGTVSLLVLAILA
ncbi:ENTP8 diphosphohydrolase, partial [Zosterops hypoxanthus]|nr:ENTP8 diphosphohydrolase [Zosterops hypoxanthus]